MEDKKSNKVFFSLLMAAFICLLSLKARADVPDFIGYQGYLTDEEGTPVSEYLNVKFSIYDSEDGLDSLWEEGQTVLASDGLISTTLGNDTPLVPDVFTAGSAYLEVEIDGDVLLPRLPIGSVPYCFYADNAPTSAEVLNWVVEGGYLTSSASDARYYQQSEIETLLGDKQDRVTGTCGDGSSIREINLDGTVVCEADDDSIFVNKSGDTMTGTLNLPTDGLAVGTDQFVCSDGNVGIGTSSPGAKLEVNGAIKYSSAQTRYYSVSATGDWTKMKGASGQGGDMKYSSGGIYPNAPYDQDSCRIPLHLPHGAVATQIEYKVYDNREGSVECELVKDDMAGTITVIGTMQASGWTETAGLTFRTSQSH